jgi:putative chitinase
MTKGLEIKYHEMLESWNINTMLRKAHFFAQLYAESRFKLKRESLYYRDIETARATFKTPFQNKSDEFVRQYLFNSEKMANYVYANRMGNGDEASGDGFKYRGGGYPQHTGFDEYYRISIYLGLDLLENPDLINDEYHAMLCACWFWNINRLNQYADTDNLDAISDIINIGRRTSRIGDANGYKHRESALKRLKKHFNVQ